MTTRVNNEKLQEALKANKLTGYYIEQTIGDICEVCHSNWKKKLALRYSDAETCIFTDTWRDLSIDEWIEYIKEADKCAKEWLKEHKDEIL